LAVKAASKTHAKNQSETPMFSVEHGRWKVINNLNILSEMGGKKKLPS